MFNSSQFNQSLFNEGGIPVITAPANTLLVPFIASTAHVFAPVISVALETQAGVSFLMTDEVKLSFTISDELGGYGQ